MDILVIHLFNALLYASVLFLIAGGLSLIYGVMRIVNLAHGNLYALGAFVTASAVGQWFAGSQSAWLYLLLPAGAIAAAAVGAVLGPTLLRPFYRRAEEYQLLVTFGLLMILEDLMRFVWGPYPLSASTLYEQLGSVSVGSWLYPRYNLLVIAIGGLGSLEGALAGSLIVGILREIGISVFPEIELAVLYLIAAIVLLVRPAGLFGRAA